MCIRDRENAALISEKEIRFPVGFFISLNRFERYSIYLKLLEVLSGSRSGFYTKHLSLIDDLFSKESGQKLLSLPSGILVRKTYKFIVFESSSETTRPVPESSLEVHTFGDYFFRTYRFNISKVAHSKYLPDSEDEFFMLNEITFPLEIRTRRPGDFIIPFGRKTPVKLKKLFIDTKVELKQRDNIPVILDNSGRIILVPGIRRSNIAPVTEGRCSLLRIRFKQN